MSKKKNKNKKKGNGGAAQPLSPERYVRERARLLPIDRCMVNTDWKENGIAHIVIARRHTTGNFTYGMYLVDTFCRGVYDTFFKFNVSEDEFEYTADMISERYDTEEVDYTVAHNIIYGAIEYAEEAGIKPHKEFALTRFILEEDTDDVPLIEYEFGKDGKHCLVVHSNFEASKYLPAMKKNLGENDFNVIIAEGDDYEVEDDDYDDEEGIGWSFDYDGQEAEYSYKHPEYPSSIDLKHQWVQDLLTTPEKDALTKDEIDRLLALPHDELRHDLEQIVLFELGRNVAGEYSEPYNPVIGHALLLLGEVGDVGSLDVVFEVMRQDDEFREYHICDGGEYLLTPPLYRLVHHNIHRLVDYLEEPGLETYFRVDALKILIADIQYFEPERRKEVLDYTHELITFLIAHEDDPRYMSSTLAGIICSFLMDICAVELAQDVEDLFATQKVDIGVCGTLNEVKKGLKKGEFLEPPEPFDIYKLYETIDRVFIKKSE